MKAKLNPDVMVVCDHHDRCVYPDFKCEHRKPHLPDDNCTRGGDCGNEPGILEWCKCIPWNDSDQETNDK